MEIVKDPCDSPLCSCQYNLEKRGFECCAPHLAIERLQKEVERLKDENKQLITDQDILAKELKDALYDVDEFAIKFLEWVDNSPYISDEISGFWSTFTKGSPKITTKELVEIYRQSLK